MLRGNKEHKHMYDLVVIGAGSAGVRASRISGSHGAKVALIESSLHHGPPTYTAVGGTCVNVGCVPKKLFVYGSHYAHDLEDSRGFGWNSKSDMTVDWKTLIDNKNKEIDRLNGIYGRMLAGAGVNLIEGTASLIDKNTVAYVSPVGETKQITGQTILVAVGGWPFKPSIPGVEHSITSNEAFYLKKKPNKIVVVGGGYIAVEFANIFHGYGTEVSLLYRGDLFLRGFDRDIRRHLADQMTKSGIELKFKTDPVEIKKLADDKYIVVCNTGEEIECDCIMYATGRKAKVDSLGLNKVGVKTDKQGNIIVNEYSQTNVDNIFAVGDVTNRMNLTPVALYEGHCFADTLYGGKDRKVTHEYICSAVFSEPEIGTVGYTEEDAVEKFKDISVFTTEFTPLKDRVSGRTYRKDYMKLIVDDNTNRVIGVHICGGSAGEMLQGFGVAVKMGATKRDFDDTIGIHPTSAEELVTLREPKYHYKKGVKVDGPRL